MMSIEVVLVMGSLKYANAKAPVMSFSPDRWMSLVLIGCLIAGARSVSDPFCGDFIGSGLREVLFILVGAGAVSVVDNEPSEINQGTADPAIPDI